MTIINDTKTRVNHFWSDDYLYLVPGDEVEVEMTLGKWNGTRIVGFDWDRSGSWEGDEVKIDRSEPADTSNRRNKNDNVHRAG